MARRWYDDDDLARAKHAPCACGCGEMADECMRGSNPLAAFTITNPDPNPFKKETDR